VAQQPEPDRWGRLRATLALTDRESRLDLARDLVDLGLAIVDVGEADLFCTPELLGVESAARSRALVFGPATAISPRRRTTSRVCGRLRGDSR
jgi:hypothetical protein